jgi:hypothetical protein
MIHKYLIPILLALSVFLTGCMEMVMEMAANSFPTYDETVKNWPKLPSQQGRIVIFTPTKNPVFSYCEITIDDVDYRGMIEGTFIFVDIKTGPHALACANNSYPSLNLNIRDGEIVYIKKYKSINGSSPFIVLNQSDVYENLKEVNHAFEEALPYDAQPITIKRREKN